ncbi:hypothetical protein [Mesorhizobium sp. CA7]|uniref:hypothetical protein n=1 Tax=Mesorhizobium sp. CA7 TaxID=588501 RepID=UPI001CCB2896|nr:hypothetical protein [Mesorhizobium sp. CA7]MBZ9815753.1 hypothetical protein [Mesorhizobium sp. CA7]
MIRRMFFAAALALASPAVASDELTLDFSTPSTAILSESLIKVSLTNPDTRMAFIGAMNMMRDYYGVDQMSEADGYRMLGHILNGKTASQVIDMARQIPTDFSKFIEGDED